MYLLMAPPWLLDKMKEWFESAWVNAAIQIGQWRSLLSYYGLIVRKIFALVSTSFENHWILCLWAKFGKYLFFFFPWICGRILEPPEEIRVEVWSHDFTFLVNEKNALFWNEDSKTVVMTLTSENTTNLHSSQRKFILSSQTLITRFPSRSENHWLWRF